MPFENDDTVAILMCTYQGGNFIDQQLESFRTQTYNNWQLYVSDDGSVDKTKEKLSIFAKKIKNKVVILSGPQKGFVANFLFLLTHSDVNAKYFAISDQDDIWCSNKLERSIQWLKQQEPSVPAVYCSRTQLINSRGQHLGCSPLFDSSPSFSNALVQSIGGGNTMVLNQEARELIMRVGVVDVVSHDWWIYILVSGAGGVVYYDPEPTLFYRQHDENLVGTNIGFRAKLRRLHKILQGSFRDWNTLHITALNRNINVLTEDNKRRLKLFEKVHDSNIFVRVYCFVKLGIYRQNYAETLAVFLAAVGKRV